MDEAFFGKLDALLAPDGCFAAVSTCEVDNFPLYTRVILECFRQIGRLDLDYDKYIEARKLKTGQDAHRHLPGIDATRAAWEKHGFKSLVLLRSLEWIPIKREDEFFNYWVSGGQFRMKEILGKEPYDKFLKVFRSIVKDDNALKCLNVRVHQVNGQEFILTPVHHYYHIARRHNPNGEGRTPCSDNWSRSSNTLAVDCAEKVASATNNPGVIDAFALELKTENLKENVKYDLLGPIIESISSSSISDKLALTRPVYVSVVQGGGDKHKTTELCKYSEEFDNRKLLVALGQDLQLTTLTNGLLGLSKPFYAGAFAMIQEIKNLDNSMHFIQCGGQSGQTRYCTDLFPGQLLLLPDGTLDQMRSSCQLSPFVEFGKQLDLKEGEDILSPMLSACCVAIKQDHYVWPRLLFNSDEGELVVFRMARPTRREEGQNEKWDWVNPLRYFIWLAYSSCPNPLAAVVVPRRLPNDKAASLSRTGFACWVPDSATTFCCEYARARSLAPALSLLTFAELLKVSDWVGEEKGEHTAAANFAHELKRVSANLEHLVLDLSSKVMRPPLALVATSQTMAEYHATIPPTEADASAEPIYAKLVLNPNAPSILRENIGICLYPRGVRDIAKLMTLWCQAYGDTDLRDLLGVPQGKSMGTLEWFLGEVWESCLRLLPLAGPPDVAFPKVTSTDEMASVASELYRLTQVSTIAKQAGLVFMVDGDEKAKHLALAQVDRTDIGWLGRALLAILRDYARFAPLPSVVRLTLTGPTQSSSQDNISEAVEHFFLVVRYMEASPTSSPANTALAEFANMQKRSITADPASARQTKKEVDTVKVVSSCFGRLNGFCVYLPQAHEWQLTFNLRRRIND